MSFKSTGEFDVFFTSSTISEIINCDLLQANVNNSASLFPQSAYSQAPFKTQVDFLRSLEIRHTLKLAKKVSFLTRNLRLGGADSKSLIYNQDGIIYDIVPHWLRYLPKSFVDTFYRWELDHEYSNCFFSRANLSFSHFVATDLAQIIIIDRVLPKDVPIVMPWLTSWQKSLLDFFGITRKLILSSQAASNQSVQSLSFTDSYAVEDLCEYEGLSYCRNAAQSLLKVFSNTANDSSQPILWIGRYAYEKKRSLTPRITNMREMNSILKSHSAIYIDPSEYTLSFVARLVYNSRIIISESGSHFINYLLFSRPGTPIIQLAPNGTLKPTWSYYNVNNMQWYHPLIPQLYFYGGDNPVQFQRRYGSPWNTPSRYDPSGLSQLISDLLSD